MKSKTRHIDGGGGNPRVHREIMQEKRFEKIVLSNKSIQFQIDKPTQEETPMKSKTRHIDGGGRNPQFETSRI